MFDRVLNTPEIKKTLLRASHVSNYIFPDFKAAAIIQKNYEGL